MRTILLVEDEAIIALAEKMTLEGFGYRALISATGEAAVEAACGGEGVDLVLMDIDLGSGIDGTEAARRILERRELPIVFLSSHSERSRVEKVRGITRYGYVVKDSGDFVLQSSIEMAFELFEAHERMRTSEARLSTLVKTIPDLVWFKDADGVYRHCNHAFERFFGSNESEIIGKTDYDFVDKDLADFFREKDRAAIALGKPSVNEEEIRFADDGHRAFLETIKTPMIDASGKVVGVLGIGRDITERKRIEEALKDSEASVQRKLNAIVEPGGDLGELGISDIVDLPTLHSLMEDLTELTGMVTALVDLDGKILVATGWQDICTKFHRILPASAEACTESDLFLAEHIKKGEFVEYHCENLLWDVVTPLYIEARHIGNIYTGQFFYDDDVVDEAAFAAQAERYGYDAEEYLAALARVPRLSREKVARLMGHLVRLTDYVSRLSYSNLRLARTSAELRGAEGLLSKSVADKEILLQELRHRVKNSLTIVASFLRLNMTDLEDEGAQRIFQEAIDRVRCVSMIYEMLSEPSKAGKVALDVYVSDLCDLLLSSYAADSKRIRVSSKLEAVECEPKRAVSVGLIFNELFTNALKYAYLPGEPGEIRVSLRDGTKAAELRIADDGPGLPRDFDLKNAKSLGLRITSLLADELGGSLEFEGGQGTTAVLRF